MDIVERAVQIAADAHKEQRRKSDKTPYIAHPIMVARMLDKAGFSDTVVAAAVVHDVIEDTDVSEETLRQELGDDVVYLVVAVSEDKSLPWEERKEQYIQTVAHATDDVKAISTADKIHNTSSIIESLKANGPSVWDHFSRGRDKSLWFYRTHLEELQKTWNHPLLDTYALCVKEMEQLD